MLKAKNLERVLGFIKTEPALAITSGRKKGTMGYNVAVIGATGNVGREMLNILAEREFPVNEVFAIASRRSIGTEVSFGDKILKCKDLETFDFSKCDFAVMSAGSAISTSRVDGGLSGRNCGYAGFRG